MAREFITENRYINADNELVIDVQGGFTNYADACKSARRAAVIAAQDGRKTTFVARPRHKRYNEEARHYAAYPDGKTGACVIVKSDVGSTLTRVDVIRVAA